MRRKLLKIFSSCANFLICALITNPAAAKTIREPDFSCLKPLTEIDQLVCATPELRKLNDRLAENYQAFMKTLDTPQNQNKLKNLQSRWLDNREKVICMNNKETEKKIACLQHIYEYRCQKLADWATRKNWDFFIEYENIKNLGLIRNFINNDGEEYFISLESNLLYPYNFSDKIKLISDECSAYLGNGLYIYNGDLLRKTEKEIIFWKGGKSFNPSSNCLAEAKIITWPQLKNIDSLIYDLNMFVSDKNKKFYFNDLKCKNKDDIKYISDQIIKGKYQFLKPIITANSFEEILSKISINCSKDKILNYPFETKLKIDTRLSPPYEVYNLGKNVLIAGNMGFPKESLYGASYILSLNKENCTTNLASHTRGTLINTNRGIYKIHLSETTAQNSYSIEKIKNYYAEDKEYLKCFLNRKNNLKGDEK